MKSANPTYEMTTHKSSKQRFMTFLSLGGETTIYFILAMILLVLCVASFLIATPFGLAMCFVLTLAISILLPASIPFIILTVFLMQNTIIAAFTPMVIDDVAFDTVRGINFVMLVSAYGAFLLATFLSPKRILPQTRPWLQGTLILLGVILFYLGLGIVRGVPQDALIYFRNTMTPVACFYITLVAAANYRIDLNRGVTWLGIIAITYGYCELIFMFDFLSLFNGDLYFERQMVKQIESGYWEKTLEETGFVLRNLNDVMTTNFFNMPFFTDIFPKVFRLSGPNFHAISYAYALAIIAIWTLLQGRWLLPLLALPLLIVIGSKGAMVFVLLAICVKVGLRFLVPTAVLLLFVIGNILWISAALLIGIRNQDYHVLGFMAGMRDFAKNPLGQGLGIGGNLSSSVEGKLDWGLAQATGATSVPVESAVGVMLYQMGVGAFVMFTFLFLLARKCRQLFLETGRGDFLFGFVSITTISVNAILQEEAFYSPLVLGFCLILVAFTLGTYWRQQSAGAAQMAAPSK